MFKQFYDDLTYLPRAKFSAKYTLPFLICLLSIILIGQLLTMFITVDQLNKVSGNIVDVETDVVGYTHHRYNSNDEPNYALVITLDNMKSYNIQETKARQILASILKKGDYITICYPTSELKILSAGLTRDVSQVERGNEVLYSWKAQQNENWFIVGLLAVFIGLFYGTKNHLRNYEPLATFNN